MRLALCAALLAALVTQPVTAQPAGSFGIGRIKTVSGIAHVLRGGAKLPIKPGFVLEKGDVIQTGKDGRVGATFLDDTRIAAGANSELSIPEFSFDDTTHAGSFVSHVQKGKVAIVSGFIAKSARDAMKIRTPTALLGVRGTRFIVEVK